MKPFDSFLKKLEAKDKAKWEKKKLAYEKKVTNLDADTSQFTTMLDALPKSPTKFEWLEDELIPYAPGSIQKLMEHKKKLEQTLFYGGHSHSPGEWWHATNSPATWSNGATWNHTPAVSASATSSANYTQVYPANYEDAFKPKMTREKAIAMNDGTWQS